MKGLSPPKNMAKHRRLWVKTMKSSNHSFQQSPHWDYTRPLMQSERHRGSVPPSKESVDKAKSTVRFLLSATGVMVAMHDTGLAASEVVQSALENNKASVLVGHGLKTCRALDIAAPAGHGLVVQYTAPAGKPAGKTTLLAQEYNDFVAGPQVAQAALDTKLDTDQTQGIKVVCATVKDYLAGLNESVLNGAIPERQGVRAYNSFKGMCKELFGAGAGELREELGVRIEQAEQEVQADQARALLNEVQQMFQSTAPAVEKPQRSSDSGLSM